MRRLPMPRCTRRSRRIRLPLRLPQPASTMICSSTMKTIWRMIPRRRCAQQHWPQHRNCNNDVQLQHTSDIDLILSSPLHFPLTLRSCSERSMCARELKLAQCRDVSATRGWFRCQLLRSRAGCAGGEANQAKLGELTRTKSIFEAAKFGNEHRLHPHRSCPSSVNVCLSSLRACTASAVV